MERVLNFVWNLAGIPIVKTKTKTTVRVSPTDEARRLIEAAAKQPGIADLIRVYESWQRFDQVFEVHNRLIAAKHIVSTSSSSGPILRQVG